jgi:hypothetical protein
MESKMTQPTVTTFPQKQKFPECCRYHHTGGFMNVPCDERESDELGRIILRMEDLPTSSVRVESTITPVSSVPQPLAPNEVQIGNSIMRFDEDVDPETRERILTEFTQSMAKERERLKHWPADYRQRMSALANLFPTMRGVPGTAPWNVDLLIKWMNGPAPTSGSWNAAMFLLGVWNPKTNWKECGLKLRKGVQGRFDFFRAIGCWDAEHEAAFMEWVKYPFWP